MDNYSCFILTMLSVRLSVDELICCEDFKSCYQIIITITFFVCFSSVFVSLSNSLTIFLFLFLFI